MNAVIYARYSSHGQTEQSIEGQLHDNYEWAQRQGIRVVGEYIDRALSGTVVDMIEVEFVRFAVFNVADCFITCGAIAFVIYIIFFSPKKESGDAKDL